MWPMTSTVVDRVSANQTAFDYLLESRKITGEDAWAGIKVSTYQLHLTHWSGCLYACLIWGLNALLDTKIYMCEQNCQFGHKIASSESCHLSFFSSKIFVVKDFL